MDIALRGSFVLDADLKWGTQIPKYINEALVKIANESHILGALAFVSRSIFHYIYGI